jgi:hypothetical protein
MAELIVFVAQGRNFLTQLRNSRFRRAVAMIAAVVAVVIVAIVAAAEDECVEVIFRVVVVEHHQGGHELRYYLVVDLSDLIWIVVHGYLNSVKKLGQ